MDECGRLCIAMNDALLFRFQLLRGFRKVSASATSRNAEITVPR